MKKILTIITVIILALGLSSCRKLPLHGDFSGMWQILSFQYPDGTLVESDHDYYYCFNRSVVMLRRYGDSFVMGNLIYGETDFTLQFPKATSDYLRKWGITLPEGAPPVVDGEIVISFHIDQLTSKRLVVTSDQGVIITMRKY